MTITTSLRTTVAAALVCVGSFTAHAQGLGGFLNKAKEKANQVGNETTKATSQATNAAEATEYQLPPSLPNAPSIEEMEDYARKMLADPRPLTADELRGSGNDPNRWYRQLVRNDNYSIKFTWDQAYMTNAKKRQQGLFEYVEDFSGQLVAQLQPYTERHAQVGAALRKVKEVHFTSVPKPEKKGEPGEESNWYFSFNPATGVLTATSPSSESYGSSSSLYSASSLSKWLISHVR